MTTVLTTRNVNTALNTVMLDLTRTHSWRWRNQESRNGPTIEHDGIFVTEYTSPCERVLFSDARDANPYFHFFEALWVLAGRDDVEFLAQFNKNISNYSDDGKTFHAPYGYRLRKAFGVDQLLEVIKVLRKDNATRQAVLQIWYAPYDLNVVSKDIPCNDMVFLKIRDGKLNMTVCCRSNDVIWGAYGANAVQFSTLLEFIAKSVGVNVGTYAQVSDSFHIYTDNDAYKRLLEKPHCPNTYSLLSHVEPFPLMGATAPDLWLSQLNDFLMEPHHCDEYPMLYDPFFGNVALPMWESWVAYKKNDIQSAYDALEYYCKANDWSAACMSWIKRRISAKTQAAWKEGAK